MDLSFSRMPTVKGIVKAAAEQEGQRQAVVELPAMGYGWIAGDGEPWQPSAGRPLVEEHLLRNEFCEASFDSESGALQSLHMPDRRGNLLSQRLALRLPAVGAKAEARYAQMVAGNDSIPTGRAFPRKSVRDRSFACRRWICRFALCANSEYPPRRSAAHL